MPESVGRPLVGHTVKVEAVMMPRSRRRRKALAEIWGAEDAGLAVTRPS